MDTNRIAELLQPFLTDAPHLNENSPSRNSCHSERSGEFEFGDRATLSQAQLQNISIYIDMLLRWNARINLTAVREPEEIVTRHFGESLFAARHLFPKESMSGQSEAERPVPANQSSASVIDLGSGAGFPGLPIKIWAPDITLTLIESNQKKATFLREVIRALTLTNINVFQGRAEHYSGQSAQVVTLRAVEGFKSILSTAANLVSADGRLALLIGEAQLPTAKNQTPTFTWRPEIPVPLSISRMLSVGTRQQ